MRTLKQLYEAHMARNGASCQHPCECTILEVAPPVPVKPSDEGKPSPCLDYSLIRDPEPEAHSEAAPKLLKLYEKICLLFQATTG